ncbi:hypothetical protein V8C43DRAFT_266615, partial [Trichoderma afarasin]
MRRYGRQRGPEEVKERNNHHDIVPSHHFDYAYAPVLEPTITLTSYLHSPPDVVLCISRSEISIHGSRQFVESVHPAACYWPISRESPASQSTALHLATSAPTPSRWRLAGGVSAGTARETRVRRLIPRWANQERFSHQHCDASETPQAAHWPAGNAGFAARLSFAVEARGERGELSHSSSCAPWFTIWEYCRTTWRCATESCL